ncbi:hypothetical protein CONLIGDRAFT_443937 [Coniochaeta ligniaria NRRL 30616]|uniref:Mid2 domain-containing protein n=1 Tax=Coniochaeta ligniaria NRRL 30616 TaxID=1408157 RepID=A0A1J7IJV3_9PEZI|nr:hypothetical protein CONLIGDRAFT_443937 [Coniochaeta ligniaria NRRL 30616]
MPSVWSCSPCVVLLLSAVLGREATATHVGKRHKDLVHRVEKMQAQITAYPKKRDATVCPSSYDLCPATLNGGCCPPRYGCATDACYATTAGTQSACSMAGYYNCGAAVGGGCCPEGYICGADDCTAPAGVSSVMTSCPASYYLCPASFNYGCCMTGYGCATNACYVTTPSTTTYTLTATTTNAGGQTVTTTQIATTVQTPTPPTAVPMTSNPNAVAKFIPTSVEKVPATSSPSSDGGGGGGLTTAQLGGIIGGAIAILLFVVLAAFIIIRRINRVANVVETAKASSSGEQSKSTRPGRPNMAQYPRPSPSEIDGMGYDPLMMTTPGDSTAGTPQPLGVHGRNRSDSDYSQPAVTPYGHASGTPSDAARHPSMDSNPSGVGYFDIPRVHNVPGRPVMRTSVDSQGNVGQYSGPAAHQQHGRQWSDASQQSNGSSDAAPGVGSPLIPAELDIAGGFIPELASADDVSPPDGGRRWSGSSGVGSPRPSLNNNRRHSSSSAVAGGLASPAMTGNQPLDPVSESTEVMHGYYGPRHGQVGQTAAGLDIHHDITSPVAVRFQGRE